MIKVLHNDSCSKSHAVLEFLDEYGATFEVIDIIKNPLDADELISLLKKLNMKPSEILRSTDQKFIEKFGSSQHSEDRIFEILLRHPEFLQRPILIKGSVAMIGRPVSNVKFFVDN